MNRRGNWQNFARRIWLRHAILNPNGRIHWHALIHASPHEHFIRVKESHALANQRNQLLNRQDHSMGSSDTNKTGGDFNRGSTVVGKVSR